jgi:exonuclease SbcD
MKFLHTSDWHIGKTIRGRTRDDEYVAALEEVLAIAKDQRVDAVLVAGDTFDSAVPPPEAERIFFHFIGELVGAQIPAVIIAGNHDHPRRINAYAPVLGRLGVQVLGEPVPASEGGVIEMPSRDGSETAVIAALPWVSERKVRDFEDLMKEGRHAEQYAEGVANMMAHLAKSFRADAVNIMLTHVLMEDARVGGPESGERPLHMGQAYVIRRQALPQTAQYIALGHVHMPQDAVLANAYYSGSLLQCDFGEAGQVKRVNIIDVAPGRMAKVSHVPLRSIRQLRNIGSAKQGVSLDEIRALGGETQTGKLADAYLKVWVKVDRPLPGLAAQVRELLPNAVDVVVERPAEERPDAQRLEGMSPGELFVSYYRRQHADTAPPEELTALFNRLHEEATSAAN